MGRPTLIKVKQLIILDRRLKYLGMVGWGRSWMEDNFRPKWSRKVDGGMVTETFLKNEKKNTACHYTVFFSFDFILIYRKL